MQVNAGQIEVQHVFTVLLPSHMYMSYIEISTRTGENSKISELMKMQRCRGAHVCV